MGAITLHPWQVRCPDTDHPDELRIDLDPQPGTDFDDVVSTAGVVREVLDDLGWVGYPKTSGGRGVHVYVRIAPRWPFVEVRRAAIALARPRAAVPVGAAMIMGRFAEICETAAKASARAASGMATMPDGWVSAAAKPGSSRRSEGRDVRRMPDSTLSTC
jgi:hypothetical protein